MDILDASCPSFEVLVDIITSDGFLCLPMSSHFQQTVRTCQDSADVWFKNAERHEKECTQHLYGEGGSLGLVGWNRPSLAKEVFRVRGTSTQAGLTPVPFHKGKDVYTGLDRCLRSLLDAVLKKSGGHTSCCSNDLCIPDSDLSDGQLSNSPFDIFFYHNKEPLSGDERVIDDFNCSVHVDPGYLTCVPTSASPGLTTVVPQGDTVCSVEMGLEQASHLVIFGGKSLSDITGGKVPACIHWVQRTPGKARVSLVYELRQTLL